MEKKHSWEEDAATFVEKVEIVNNEMTAAVSSAIEETFYSQNLKKRKHSYTLGTVTVKMRNAHKWKWLSFVDAQEVKWVAFQVCQAAAMKSYSRWDRSVTWASEHNLFNCTELDQATF